MSRNFNANVDTQREYYNCQYFNTSGIDQQARYEVQLLKAFFMDPQNWKLSINRASVPLSMPLTKNNIPFQQWQIGIQYNDGTNPPTNDIEYVQQYNASTVNINANKYYSISNRANSYTLSGQGFNYELDFINFTPNITPQLNGQGFDYANIDVDNQFFYAVISPTQFTIYDARNGTVYKSHIEPPTFNCYSCCADRTTGDAYIASTDGVSAYITKFTRTGYSWSATSQYYTFPAGTNIDSSLCINCVSGSVFAIVAPVSGAPPGTDLTAYQFSPGNPNPVFTTNLNIIGEAQGSFPNMITDGSDLYILYFGTLTTALSKYDTSFNLLSTVSADGYINYGGIGAVQNQFLVGFDYNGDLLFSFAQAINQQGLLTLSSANFAQLGVDLNFPNPDPKGASLIYTKPANNQPIDAGAYDIYTIQDFLNKINSALAVSFNNLRTQLGASFLPTEPPLVIFQASTKLFELVFEGLYGTLNGNGTNQYSIFFNQALWQRFNFPANPLTVGAITYQSMLLTNYGFNAIQGNGSASLPQFISNIQNQSTIYAFNDLTRIIFATTQIPVSGDGDGVIFTNAGTTANRTLNMITDIAPDTTTQLVGTRLIYVPAGILRWYNLYAQQPFSKIDIQVYYEMKDGQIYPLIIPNGEYFAVKLEFKKGEGDF